MNPAAHRFTALAVAALLLLAARAASAQVELTGDWLEIGQQSQTNQAFGSFPGDFTGIPLNQEGRAAALAFSAEALEQLDRQCQPWPVHYIVNGPFGLRVTTQRDPNTGNPVALHIAATVDRMAMTIWLDGRTAPAEAMHTFAGFTTGEWRGATLVTTTTHIKDGFLTRNGVPNSSQETFQMYITRHGDLLTITGIVHDPAYLTAPYPWAETYRLNRSGARSVLDVPGMQCLPEETIEGLSDGYHTATTLPGQSTILNYMLENYGIPQAAAMGGERTMLPAFQHELRKGYKRPTGECKQNCCGSEGSQEGGDLRRLVPRNCRVGFPP